MSRQEWQHQGCSSELIVFFWPIRQSQAQSGETSFETYTTGELLTYSLPTLYALWAHMQNLNLNQEILEHTAAPYGFSSLEAL